MKIALIGAPGSGKTWIANIIARELTIPHIEGDKIFWKNGKELPVEEFRLRVSQILGSNDWVFEGHIGKLADIVLPKADKIIVVEYPEFFSLLRALVRDYKNLKRIYFNIQNYERLFNKRKDLIEELVEARPNDVIFLDNFSDLSESDLAALCKELESSTVKTKK